FNDMKQQIGCAMIFISHDLTVVNHVDNHVAVMRAGRLVEQGTSEAVLYHPQHAYTSYLLATKKKISDHFQRVMRGECNA
ncbi:MAG: nickel import ATP-binding protein NikD, partial [Staphylococcus lugdunensis]|nr:nickel import ATP-binding protein NikD [Staphylococcus lugdunensis]